MAAVTAFPFLRAPADAVRASEWTDHNGSPLPVEGTLPNWDPWADIRATRQIVVNPGAIREACGLGRDALLRFVTAWYSPVTALLEPAPCVDVEDDGDEAPVALGIHIPGHKVGGEVAIRTSLVLADPGSGGGALSPVMPGSSLWNDVHRVQLEGTGARFPVEITDFPSDMDAAGWSLDITPELEFPFLGAVRLNVNQRHETIRAAIESTNPDRTEQVIVAMIYADTARQLARFALSNDEFVDRVSASAGHCPFEEDTTGYALWALLTQFFPDYSLKALRGALKSTPEHFDSLLHDRVRILSGI